MEKYDLLVFDVDGVLLDVTNSFPEVIKVSIQKGFERYCGGEVDTAGYTKKYETILKLHGGFNDDYDLAWMLLSFTAFNGGKKLSESFPSTEQLKKAIETFSGSVKEWVYNSFGDRIPYEEFRESCNELYCGTEKTAGLQTLETPLLHAEWNNLPLPVGLYTGRDTIELQLAFKSLSWKNFPMENAIHRETGICKPSPKGLEILCEKFDAESPLFFGDTASDLIAHKAFGKGGFVAIGNLLADVKNRYDNCDEALKNIFG